MCSRSSHVAVKPPHRTGECCGYPPSTKLKRFETVKAFFSFCVSRDWIAKDPAKAVEAPKVRHIPTLPFSDAEMEKLLWAVDTFREIHSQIPEHRTEAPGDDPPPAPLGHPDLGRGRHEAGPDQEREAPVAYPEDRDAGVVSADAACP